MTLIKDSIAVRDVAAKQKLQEWHNAQPNKTKRSCTQFNPRKQVIAFQDGVTATPKGGSTPTKTSKIDMEVE